MAPSSSNVLDTDQKAALARGCTVCGVRILATRGPGGYTVRTTFDDNGRVTAVTAWHNHCFPRPTIVWPTS